MHDLDSALDELRGLSDRPPTQCLSLTRLRERVARRRARRRVCAASLFAAAVVFIGVTAAPSLIGVESEDVRASDGPGAPSAVMNGLMVQPAEDLDDGQIVTVTGPFETVTLAGVAQCASEAVNTATPLSWCDLNVTRDVGPGPLKVTVLRSIQTMNGLVDCAERPQRCLIGVGADGLEAGAVDLTAPISFRSDIAPLPVPLLTIDEIAAVDGEVRMVSGAGFVPNAHVSIVQCVGEPTQDWGDGERARERCDTARMAPATADDNGTFTVPVILYAEVQIPPGWTACDPCILHARGERQRPAVTTVAVLPGVTPARPTVIINPEGPYEPGQTVALDGSGFQPHQDGIVIGWCGFLTDAPEQEIQGDPKNGYTPCSYPNEGFTADIDNTGRFRIENFPLPDGAFGWGDSANCRDPSTRCGLAWHPGEGQLPVFVTLFELRR